jgi:hypothetical protein
VAGVFAGDDESQPMAASCVKGRDTEGGMYQEEEETTGGAKKRKRKKSHQANELRVVICTMAGSEKGETKRKEGGGGGTERGSRGGQNREGREERAIKQGWRWRRRKEIISRKALIEKSPSSRESLNAAPTDHAETHFKLGHD